MACAVSPRIVLEWEKGVLLRLGKFNRVLDAGIVWIISGMDTISSLVDMRNRLSLILQIRAGETVDGSFAGFKHRSHDSV